jgi:hypothetical protein
VGRACSTHRVDEKLIQFFVGRPEGRRTHGSPRHRWEDNIKMDLNGIRSEVVDWLHVTQDRD